MLPPPQRLPLLAEVLGRFFFWVTTSIVAILASGLGLIFGAGGFGNSHVSVHAMFAIALVMMAIFVAIRLGPYPRLRQAIAGSDWPAAAASLDTIRRLVATNLALGITTIAVATIGRALI